MKAVSKVITNTIEYELKMACKIGDIKRVKRLVENQHVDPDCDNNHPIRIVSANGHIELVKFLLRHPKVDPTASDNHAIRVASEKGHTEVVKLLLADPRVDATDKDNYAIQKASEYGHAEVVKLLLDYKGDDQRKPVDPGANNNYAIGMACTLGGKHLDVVKLLLHDPRVDPSANDNRALKIACQEKHTKIVELLLTHPKVDPNAAIENAIESNDSEIETAIYCNEKTNFSGFLLSKACKYKKLKDAKVWLEDGVNPAINDYYPIRVACKNNDLPMLAMLISHPAVTFEYKHHILTTAMQGNRDDIINLVKADPNYAICAAAENGNIDSARSLLDDERVNPAADNNFAIRVACQNGHLEIVKLLLADKRVNPAADDNFAIRVACKWGDLGIVNELLRHPLVIPSANNNENEAMRNAFEFNHPEVAMVLFPHLLTNPKSRHEIDPKLKNIAYHNSMSDLLEDADKRVIVECSMEKLIREGNFEKQITEHDGEYVTNYVPIGTFAERYKRAEGYTPPQYRTSVDTKGSVVWQIIEHIDTHYVLEQNKLEEILNNYKDKISSKVSVQKMAGLIIDQVYKLDAQSKAASTNDNDYYTAIFKIISNPTKDQSLCR
jgi:ankyrin repeat protein